MTLFQCSSGRSHTTDLTVHSSYNLSIFRYDGHGMRLDTAIEGCTSTQTVVLLAHQPKAAKDAIMSRHKIDLILSGRFSCTFLIHFDFYNVTIRIIG